MSELLGCSKPARAEEQEEPRCHCQYCNASNLITNSSRLEHVDSKRKIGVARLFEIVARRGVARGALVFNYLQAKATLCQLSGARLVQFGLHLRLISCTLVHMDTTERKRLVVELDFDEHVLVATSAHRLNMTLSNYIRMKLKLPAGRQGVRRTMWESKAGKDVRMVLDAGIAELHGTGA
jgi:hypothetical protein